MGWNKSNQVYIIQKIGARCTIFSQLISFQKNIFRPKMGADKILWISSIQSARHQGDKIAAKPHQLEVLELP